MLELVLGKTSTLKNITIGPTSEDESGYSCGVFLENKVDKCKDPTKCVYVLIRHILAGRA